jgi:hypothetical protein
MTTNTRKVPYGWKLDGGKQVKDIGAQRIIKQILEHHRKGFSLAMIAKNLNERGVPSQRGGKWYGSSVGNIIQANEAAVASQATSSKTSKPDLFEWVDGEIDEETGQERNVARQLIAETEAMSVQAQALRNLTVAEKAEAFRFDDPLHFAFGSSWGITGQHGIDEIVAEMTRKRGYDIHKLIDGLKDQPATKALLRQLANLLCREIAILRQANLHLRQERLEQARKLWRLEHPPSATQPTPTPRDRLVLKRTVDPLTVKQTFPKR